MPLRRLLELIALALAGRAASRLLALLGAGVCRDALIQLVRALPDPGIGQVTVLGVDDFSKRRGHSYATLLINMDTRKPVDVLDDREASSLAGWLREHPEVFGLHAAGRTRVSYETRPLAEVNEAIAEVLHGKARARLVLVP